MKSRVLLIAALLSPLRLLAQTPIVMPLEVLGPDGYVSGVSFNLDSPLNDMTSICAVFTINGLEYATQASFQVNDGPWIPISNDILVPGLGVSYGGIGGGFSTLKFRKRLPLQSIATGVNHLRFRFNGTDGNSSGFRVLNFNFMARFNGAGQTDSAEIAVLPPSAFVNDDPSQWTPPLNGTSDITEGERLWRQASLTGPVPGGDSKPLLAHCMDCHTQDGRDLQYFNYSNFSIRARSVFHGLTAAQGDQIASYIRSLNVPNPGRPWNPPYQPGPGLDSQPVANWAAGAGIDAVLDSDAAMLPYVAPTLTAADFNPAGNLNIRETPIAFQLPDWNRWLPKIHPVDVWRGTFTGSTLFTTYEQLRNKLTPGDPNSYSAQKYTISNWMQYKNDFKGTVPDPSFSTSAGATQVYSLSLWQLVKLWELNQEFALEDMLPAVTGTAAEPRGWLTNIPFQSSPSINKIPPGSPGIGNGSAGTFEYFSFMWYYSQLILNSGDKQQLCTNPVDWGYFYGFIGGMTRDSAPQAMLLLTMMQKALQISNNGKGPQVGCILGWSPFVNDPSRLVSLSLANIWNDLPPSTTSSLINSYLTSWLSVFKSYSPQQFTTGGYTSPAETVTLGYGEGNMPSRFAFMIPRLQCLGASASLTDVVLQWSAQAWPAFNWDSVRVGPCPSARFLGAPPSQRLAYKNVGAHKP